LSAAANRLVELDVKDYLCVAELAQLPAGRFKGDHFADKLTGVLADWLRPGKLERMLARSELFLGATRDAVLKQIMDGSRRQFRQLNYDCFVAVGAKPPARSAESLIHFILGVLYSRSVAAAVKVNIVDLRVLTRGTNSLLLKGKGAYYYCKCRDKNSELRGETRHPSLPKLKH
jgi:hypothetical protein